VHVGLSLCSEMLRRGHGLAAVPVLNKGTISAHDLVCAAPRSSLCIRSTEQAIDVTENLARFVSQLQKQILQWLATDHRRTRGMMASSHQELVQALQRDKGNISHSLQTLERHGLLIIGRSPGGHAESLHLTPAGHQRAAQLPGSCD